MNVLIIGSGGREHALAWAISASPVLDRLYCAPGNAGIAEVAQCMALDVTDHGTVASFCRDKGIDLVVVGPEGPLVAGMVDDLAAAGIKAFGPTRAAARLEGSKSFAKELCARYGIPTADYRRVSDVDEALTRVRERSLPLVVKADGLAAGKGVVIATTVEEAERAVRELMSGKFGESGSQLVIEDFLEGEEASFFALCDGRTVLPLATAQDHKRALDGDQGPNTGGMGAYSPAPVMTDEMCARVMAEIVKPTVEAMAAMGCPYKGVLYAGLMVTKEGPQLLEYNVRFGDPECQVLMMRLKDDILTLMLAAVDGTLDRMSVRWWPDVALTVVLAAKGYPGEVKKGTVIRGLDAARTVEGVEIFHAATERDGEVVRAAGGRVLNVTARASTIEEAQTRAYRAVDLIDWPDGFCRRDIGWRALGREKA